MNVNGVLEDHGDDYEKDYLTDNIGRYALDFLSNRDSERPFLMVLALPASHAPFTPAPQYSNEFPEQVSFFKLLTVKTLGPSIKYFNSFFLRKYTSFTHFLFFVRVKWIKEKYE